MSSAELIISGVKIPGKIGLPERGIKRNLFESVWSAGTMICSAILKKLLREVVKVLP